MGSATEQNKAVSGKSLCRHEPLLPSSSGSRDCCQARQLELGNKTIPPPRLKKQCKNILLLFL
jgi:hypothetical protein